MELEEKKGDRWLRLGDLAAHEVIVVRCPCGRSVEYHKGFLQRRHRVPSDFLVYDLQFRLRCSHCNARAGFRITIFDTRTRGDNLEAAVGAGGCGGGADAHALGDDLRTLASNEGSAHCVQGFCGFGQADVVAGSLASLSVSHTPPPVLLPLM